MGIRVAECCCTCEDWLQILQQTGFEYDVHTDCDQPGQGQNLRGVRFFGQVPNTNLLIFAEVSQQGVRGNDNFVCCSSICYITKIPLT